MQYPKYFNFSPNIRLLREELIKKQYLDKITLCWQMQYQKYFE